MSIHQPPGRVVVRLAHQAQAAQGPPSRGQRGQQRLGVAGADRLTQVAAGVCRVGHAGLQVGRVVAPLGHEGACPVDDFALLRLAVAPIVPGAGRAARVAHPRAVAVGCQESK